jgi:small subunit ribosomal protein S18
VAKQRSNSGSSPRSRRDTKGTGGRRKSCPYCKDKVDRADYKDTAALSRFLSDRGKIRSRGQTGACRRHQSQLARAVKRARELALLPYVGEGGREEATGGRRRGREER